MVESTNPIDFGKHRVGKQFSGGSQEMDNCICSTMHCHAEVIGGCSVLKVGSELLGQCPGYKSAKAVSSIETTHFGTILLDERFLSARKRAILGKGIFDETNPEDHEQAEKMIAERRLTRETPRDSEKYAAPRPPTR